MDWCIFAFNYSSRFQSRAAISQKTIYSTAGHPRKQSMYKLSSNGSNSLLSSVFGSLICPWLFSHFDTYMVKFPIEKKGIY